MLVYKVCEKKLPFLCETLTISISLWCLFNYCRYTKLETLIPTINSHLQTDESGVPFLFILGRPRSGTTLLRMIFEAHPNVLIPPECQFIINLSSKYGGINFWTRQHLNSFFEDLKSQWRIEMWNLDWEKLWRNLQQYEGKHSYGAVCKVVYQSYESLFPKAEIRLYGDKNPGYSIYTERLRKIYPNARFIYLNRDYRDNYVSLRDVHFDLSIPSLTAQKWKYYYKTIIKSANKLPEYYKIVRYEDLVANPEVVVKQLCEFVGITYFPEMLDYYKKSDDFTKTYPPDVLKKYHSRITQKVNGSRTGIWQEKLTKKEVMQLEATIGSLGEKAGYPRSYSHINPLVYLAILPGRILAAMLYVATFIVDKLPAGIRMNILSKWPRAIAMIILRVVNPKKLNQIRASRNTK